MTRGWASASRGASGSGPENRARRRPGGVEGSARREQDPPMATRLARFESGLSELRYFPTAKHVRAVIDGTTVIDSRRAVLLWEPQRVVPQYAVPITDVA